MDLATEVDPNDVDAVLGQADARRAAQAARGPGDVPSPSTAQPVDPTV